MTLLGTLQKTIKQLTSKGEDPKEVAPEDMRIQVPVKNVRDFLRLCKKEGVPAPAMPDGFSRCLPKDFVEFDGNGSPLRVIKRLKRMK